MPEPGIFISFEGGEGVGKSTHIRLLAARLEQAGYSVLLLREPGGTPVGEQIRAILLDPCNAQLCAASELLLYEAARAQLVASVIRPALLAGQTVLCDRFTDSTLAYQGMARGLGWQLVQRANTLGSQGLVPQRTIVLTDDLQQSLARATEEGADRLELEGLDFHARVLEGFAQIAAAEPQRVRLVASQADKRDTARAVFDQVRDLFPKAQTLDFQISDELLEACRRVNTR